LIKKNWILTKRKIFAVFVLANWVLSDITQKLGGKLRDNCAKTAGIHKKHKIDNNEVF
jgi:hypothetical protein